MKTSPVALVAASALSLLIGIGGTWLALSERPAPMERMGLPESFDSHFGDRFMDDLFDERFFERSRDPFQEMERMQQRLETELFNMRGEFEGLPNSGWFTDRFNDWFSDRYGNRSAGAISMREDDEYYYYELDLGDDTDAEINVNVEGDDIMIEARSESSRGESSAGSAIRSHSLSSLHQRFPMPADGDPQSVTVEQNEGVVTIRIAKIA